MCALWSNGTLDGHSKLHPAELCHSGMHKTPPQTSPAPPVPPHVRSHTGRPSDHPALYSTAIAEMQPFQGLYHGRPSVLFKITCHIYWGVYTFPDHLATLKTILFLLRPSFFLAVISGEVLGCCAPLSQYSHELCGLYCAHSNDLISWTEFTLVPENRLLLIDKRTKTDRKHSSLMQRFWK